MAKPVISPTQSVQGWLQYQNFRMQFYATNAPTGWTFRGTIPGVTPDTDDGFLDGAGTTPGLYQIGVVASNGDGDSDEVVFTFQIAPSSISPDIGVDLEIDTIARLVSITKPQAAAATPEDAASVVTAEGETPILIVKQLDDLMTYIRFKKNGVVQELDIPDGAENLVFSIKEIDTEKVIVESDGWAKKGSGSSTYYVIHTPLTGDAIASALSNYQKDEGTSFLALCEIKWVTNNPLHDSDSVGPATIRSATQNFRIQIFTYLAAA